MAHLRLGPLGASSLRFDPFGGVSFAVGSVGGVVFAVRSFWRRVFWGRCLCGSVRLGRCLLRFNPFKADVFYGMITWRHFCSEALSVRFNHLDALRL
jgi:hypothetical protein